jgi:hypothetical protein
MSQASSLQRTTLFGDEDTINAQAFLASMGLEENAIKRLIPLTQDFATTQGIDLGNAAKLVAKSVGSSTNALTRYGITIEGAVGSSERLESAITALNKQVGGQAVAAAQVGTGSLTQLKNAVNDLKENLGELIAESLTPTAKRLVQWAIILNKNTDEVGKLQARLELANMELKKWEENTHKNEEWIKTIKLKEGREEVKKLTEELRKLGVTSENLPLLGPPTPDGGSPQISDPREKKEGNKLDTIKAITAAITELQAARQEMSGVELAAANIEIATLEELKKSFENLGTAREQSIPLEYLQLVSEEGTRNIEVLDELNRFINMMTENKNADTEATNELSIATNNLATAHERLGKSIKKVTPVVDEQTAAIMEGRKKAAEMEIALESMSGMERAMFDATIEASNAFMQQAMMGEMSFRRLGKAALKAARDVVAAAIARGVSEAVAGALTNVPYPWNLAAGAAAGAAAAGLFTIATNALMGSGESMSTGSASGNASVYSENLSGGFGNRYRENSQGNNWIDQYVDPWEGRNRGVSSEINVYGFVGNDQDLAGKIDRVLRENAGFIAAQNG